MKLISLDAPRDHLQSLIIHDIMKHLKETDENKKLRIALLLRSNFPRWIWSNIY